ncbi:MAG: hypothetical protein COA78_18925 [Blastopirellula sp.]|nr:MAG: hypothetical protein COA78_18925 [Blastopirellula sp.]
MYIRALLLALPVVLIGCNASQFSEKLTSQLPRADGSMLEVECISYVEHNNAFVSPTLKPQPQVTVILDERTIVVHADKILLNGELYASLASDVKKLRIEITENSFIVTADGEPVTKLAEPVETAD